MGNGRLNIQALDTCEENEVGRACGPTAQLELGSLGHDEVGVNAQAGTGSVRFGTEDDYISLQTPNASCRASVGLDGGEAECGASLLSIEAATRLESAADTRVSVRGEAGGRFGVSSHLRDTDGDGLLETGLNISTGPMGFNINSEGPHMAARALAGLDRVGDLPVTTERGMPTDRSQWVSAPVQSQRR